MAPAPGAASTVLSVATLRRECLLLVVGHGQGAKGSGQFWSYSGGRHPQAGA